MAGQRRDYLSRVRRVARAYPTRPALGVVRSDGLDLWNYREVWGGVSAASARLAEMGVRPHDRIGILGDTVPSWGVAELAVFHHGAIAVPLEPHHPDKVIEAILSDAGAVRVLVSSSQSERASRLPLPVTTFADLLDPRGDAGRDLVPHPVEPDQPRLLVYTSGTTGDPKGVTLTDGNLTAQFDALLQVVDVGRDDVILSILPFSHIYAQVVNLLAPLILGASVRFAEEPTPQAVRRALERGGVTAFGAVPQFFSLFRDRVLAEVRSRGTWASRGFRALQVLSRVVRQTTRWNPGRLLFPSVHRAFGGRLKWIVSAGSYLDPGLARQYTDWGFALLNAYGLTECSAAVTVTPPGAADPTTVGRAIPGVEVRIDRPDGDAVGEVLVRGPIVMAGYWNRPEATAAVIDRNGWYHTGDLGCLDGKGNLTITGRAKELVVLASGKNVYPEELDDHYSDHPLFREVCVLGLPEPGGGERLHAVVVPDLDEFRRRGITRVADEVRFEMENRGLELPSYQRVRFFSLWTEPLPRTTTRKVRRLEVRRRVLSEDLDTSGASLKREFKWTPADEARLRQPVVQAVIQAGGLEERVEGRLHPDMSLEFDLGLDSLARAELIALLSRGLTRPLDPETSARALTLDELAGVVEAAQAGEGVAPEIRTTWKELLEDPACLAEAREHLPTATGGGAVVGRFTVGLTLLTAKLFCRFRVVGIENLPRQTRPLLVTPNHNSFPDPFLVAAAMPWDLVRESCYLGFADYFGRGLIRWVARQLRVIPVDTGRDLVRAIQLGGASLAMGKVLVLFPEGERSVDGRLRPFKRGAALLVRHTGAVVVPVGIVGVYEVWPRGRRFPRPGRITLAFGPPLDFRPGFTEDEDADVSRINRDLHRAIADLVQEQGGPAPHPHEETFLAEARGAHRGDPADHPAGAEFDSPGDGC